MQAAPLTELWTQCEISRSQSIDPTRTLFDASVGHGLFSGLHCLNFSMQSRSCSDSDLDYDSATQCGPHCSAESARVTVCPKPPIG